MIKYSTGDSSDPFDSIVCNYNDDYQLDIIVNNYITCSIGIFLGHGNGSFEGECKNNSN